MPPMPDAPNAPQAPAGPGTALMEDLALEVVPDQPWTTVLLNDPVNLVDYVTLTLMKVLQVPKDQAENLMMRAHLEGQVVVKTGSRQDCQSIKIQLETAALFVELRKQGDSQ